MLSVSNLAIGYGAEAVARDLSFSLNKGEILAVIGHNGSGKSTLLKTILGIERVQTGTLTWTTGARPAPLGYLGQLTDFDRRFPMRVCDLVATGGWSRLGFFDTAGRAARRQADAALDPAGSRDLARLPPHILSAAQLQREEDAYNGKCAELEATGSAADHVIDLVGCHGAGGAEEALGDERR